jgi:hypothetical protein
MIAGICPRVLKTTVMFTEPTSKPLLIDEEVVDQVWET